MKALAFIKKASVGAVPMACLTFALAGCSANSTLPNNQPAANGPLQLMRSRAIGDAAPTYPATGANPWGPLTKVGTKYYGLAREGGANQLGAIFKVTGGGVETVPYSFSTNDGSFPTQGLLHAGNFLYGVTPTGGTSNCGTVFKKGINGGGGFNVIHTFNCTDGAYAIGVQAIGNMLYGVTYQGGTHNEGTVFKMSMSGGSFTTLYNFGANSTDGEWPSSLLTQVGSALYGVTYTGGTHTYGTVYKITPSGTYTGNLYNFAGGTDGVFPESNLILANNVLYGTTVQGGSQFQWGTVYKFAVNTNTETVLHSFGTGCDGVYPIGNIIKVNSVLIGTTQGLTNSCATFHGGLYSVPVAGGNTTVLHQFGGGTTDGDTPYGGVLKDGNTLYGTTIMGGANGYGTVFKAALSGSPESILYSF